MSDGLPYADILILALIAGFILLRLRNVLGQNVGRDPRVTRQERPEQESPVIRPSEPLPRPEAAPEETLPAAIPAETRAALEQFRARDASFSYSEFTRGAKAAFEMVFDAFSSGDRDTLKMLLSLDVYKMFASELDRRTASGTRAETTLLSVSDPEVTSAELNGNKARITMRFVSEQVSVVRDASGAIIEGNASGADRVEDEWTFERDLTSRNPNWTIIDT